MISDIRRWDTQPTWWNTTPLDTGVQGDTKKAERYKSRDIGIQNVQFLLLLNCPRGPPRGVDPIHAIGRASTPGSVSSWGQARTNRFGSGNRQVFFEIELAKSGSALGDPTLTGIPRKEFLGADSNKLAKRSARLPGPETVTRRTGRVKTCTSFEPTISILSLEIVVILSPGKIWRCLWAMRSHFRSSPLS